MKEGPSNRPGRAIRGTYPPRMYTLPRNSGFLGPPGLSRLGEVESPAARSLPGKRPSGGTGDNRPGRLPGAIRPA
jgi:hypothetical protein